jgi:WD40 repeat protein
MEERVADEELLSESRLGPAEQWLAERPADISAEVVELVEQSRSVWRRRIAELERANAEAEARRLAAASELLTATTAPGGTLPLALAIESIRTLWTLEGDTALRHALRTAPVPVVRIPDPGDGFTDPRLTSSGSHVIRGKELFEVNLEEREYRPVQRPDSPVIGVTGDGRTELRTDTHRVAVVDTRTGATLADDHDRAPIVTAALSEDGTRLTVVRGQRTKDDDHDIVKHATITVFELPGRRLRHRLTLPLLRGSLCFSPDHTLLAATTTRYSRMVHHKWLAGTTIYDLVREKKLATIDHDGDPTLCLAFSPDGKLLAAGSNDVDSCGDAHNGGLEVFDLTRGGKLSYRLDQYLPVLAIAFAPAGDRLAVAVGDVRHAQTPGFGILVEAATGRELHRLHHDYPVKNTGFNADGSRVFFSGHRSARVFTARRGDEQLRVDHEQELGGTVFAPDGRGLVTVTQERGGPTRVFRSGSVAVTRFDWPDGNLLQHAEVSPDGSRLVASYSNLTSEVGRSGHTVSWVIDTMTATRRTEIRHGPHGWAMALSDDGSRMALLEVLRLVVHDLDGDRAPLQVDDGSTHGVRDAWFTEDGTRVFTVAYNSAGPSSSAADGQTVIRSTDVRTGRTVSSVSIAGYVWTVSPDGTLAAVGTGHEEPEPRSEHREIAVVETAGGTERFRFRTRSGNALRFALTGEWISAVCDSSLVLHRTSDGTQLWSTALDLREAKPLHQSEVVISPTGACLAVIVGTFDQATTVLVDTRDGRHITKFESPRRMSASFSSDGHRAAVVTDGAAHVVDLDSAATLCVIEHEVHHIDHARFVGATGKHLLTKDHRGFRVSSIDSTSVRHEAEARLARELTDSEQDRYLRHS